MLEYDRFDKSKIDKKELYLSKQAISLNSVDLSKIVSSKWKINDTKYKYLCGYLKNDVLFMCYFTSNERIY